MKGGWTLRRISPIVFALALITVVRAAPQDSAAPTQTFEDFLAGVRTEALARGLHAATLDAALSGLTPDPVVVARDRTQPELTQSLEEYVTARVTPRVIATARDMAVRHRDVLDRVADAYGVPPPVLVSVWGLESNFGQFTGTYSTIRALATLAYDGRRTLFRNELLEALAIVDDGRIAPAELKGSWAGAMGQPQFMPSKFRQDAVDFDRDGRADIWTSVPDVFASIASFLKSSGWTGKERWGREVRLTKSVAAKIDRDVPLRTAGCRANREMTVKRPLNTWRSLGAKNSTGGALPGGTLEASLVRGHTRAFLVYDNYAALLAYNCSNSYAVAVGILADRMQ